MSKFKRISAFVVTCAMVFSLMTSYVGASALPEDVMGTKYEEPIELLKALEVMVGDADTGEFRLEDSMLRSEFAKVAVYLAGLSEVASSSTYRTRFPDVVDNHWATGFINVAEQQGYVIGDDAGNFRPDDKITFSEAVTVITRVLGYEPSAESAGGFPTGYTVVAGQIGLFKNGATVADKDAPATRGNIAIMSFNSLSINMMEKVSFGANESYEVVNKQILTEKLDVVKKYGQVTANSQSSLTGASSLRDNEVSIASGGETAVYKVGKTNARDFLARNVIFYVRDKGDNTDLELVLVRNDKNRNEEFTVTAENIDALTGAADADKTLTYWLDKVNDRTTQKATISKDAVVFYNGVATSGDTKYDLADLNDLGSGSVTLIDTASRDVYNYVFVKEFSNLVVDDISLVSFRITDKFNHPTLTLDPEDRNLKFSIRLDGKEIALKDLKEWDVLSVAMDQPEVENARVINIEVSRKTVTGRVTETQDGKFKIDGNLYEVAANYTESGQPDIQLNDEGTFFLDVEGKIAAVDTATVAGSKYAYLADAELTGTIDNTLELKVFTMEGATEILKTAAKVKVNSTTNRTPAQALADLKDEDDKVAQLITYEVNSKGEVYYINTASLNESGAPKKNIFSLDFASDEEGIEYRSASKKLGSFNVNANTVVFDIPKGEDDTDNYAVRNMSMFVDKTKYEVEIYDLSDDLTAKVIIVKNSKGATNAESPIAVVTKVALAQGNDDITTEKLYAMENGEAVEILAKDTATLVKGEGENVKKLTTGDIVQYTKNARGEIDKVTVLFDSEDRSNANAEKYKLHEGTEMETVLGRVTRKFATSINVTADGMSETNFNIEGATVYSYNYTKPVGSQITVVDASYITKYDSNSPEKVFLRIYKGEVKEVVIIKA